MVHASADNSERGPFTHQKDIWIDHYCVAMSFDLAIWAEDVPITCEEASRKYLEVMEETGPVSAPGEGVVELLEALLQRWPALELVDKTHPDELPWAMTPGVQSYMLSIVMRFPEARKVYDEMVSMALDRDLVVFDPQRNAVLWPRRLQELPHFRVFDEAGTIVDSPSGGQLRDHVRSLNTANSYLVLSLRAEFYMQTKVNKDGRYVVEYRDGGSEHHYRIDHQDGDDTYQLLSQFSGADDSWRTSVAWKKLDLG